MHIQRFQGNFVAQKTTLFFCIFSPPKSLKANQIQGLLRLDPRRNVGWRWTNPSNSNTTINLEIFFKVCDFSIFRAPGISGFFFVECRVELFGGRNSLRIYAPQQWTGNGFFLIRSYWTVNQHHPWCQMDLLTSMDQQVKWMKPSFPTHLSFLTTLGPLVRP